MAATAVIRTQAILGYKHQTAVDKQSLTGVGWDVWSHTKLRESSSEIPQELICLNGYDRSPNMRMYCGHDIVNALQVHTCPRVCTT